jgi:hypothetical protein
MMLFARAFELFFQHRELASSVLDLNLALRSEIPMVSLRVLLRSLGAQQIDGSWYGSCEVTSYAVLALASLETLPWVRQLDTGKIVASMALGKSFLSTNRGEWTNGRHLWIEKVTYSSTVLSEAYCLAAALVPLPSTLHPQPGANSGRAILPADARLLLGMRKAGNLIARTPLFDHSDAWALRVAEMQACFALQALQRQPVDVFPRTARGKDKYLFLIPLAEIVSALASDGASVVSLSVSFEMMLLSMLNFHADEYMEGVVERHFEHRLEDVRSVVRQLFTDMQLQHCSNTNDDHMAPSRGEELPDDSAPTAADVKANLGRFVRRILHHSAVLSSPASLQAHLAFELQTFLLNQITQAEDNHRARAQRAKAANLSNSDTNLTSNSNTHSQQQLLPQQQYNPGRTFHHWVRTTSADNIMLPFSFLFFICLVHHAVAAPKLPPHSPVNFRSGSKSSESTSNDDTPSAAVTPAPSSSNNNNNNNSSKETRRHHATPLTASARAAYLAEDACRHLAALCRMYNDAGSASRDADEGTLNALDFPEFLLPPLLLPPLSLPPRPRGTAVVVVVMTMVAVMPGKAGGPWTSYCG